LHAVTLTLRDLNEATEAELWRFKVQALLAVFIENEPGRAGGPLSATSKDAEQRVIEELGPGMVHYLRPGQKPTMLTPSGAGGFGDWVRHHLLATAAGADLPYHTLTGDLSRANFASYKIGQIGFGRMIEQNQEQWLIPQLCRPVWNWFIDALFLAGKITRRDYRVTFTAPPLQEADEYKAAMAALLRMRSGQTSAPEEIRRLGYDPREVLDDIAEWNAAMDAAGVVLDSDPRTTNQKGVLQSIQQMAGLGGTDQTGSDP
ncbi:MAG: phage portal protein, partial [Alphaproteobacteria bacterium]